jgi:NhaP-type Na+/H+ or K+/H+ antiporter
MVGIYIIVCLARLVSFLVFKKYIFTMGYGCTTAEFMVFIHGGLRGAVGLSFALLANADESLTPALRDIFLFNFSGICVFTLIINAPTTKILIEYMGILATHKIKD